MQQLIQCCNNLSVLYYVYKADTNNGFILSGIIVLAWKELKELLVFENIELNKKIQKKNCS